MRFIKISILFYLFVYGLLISILMYLGIIRVNLEIMTLVVSFTFICFILFLLAYRKKRSALKSLRIETGAFRVPVHGEKRFARKKISFGFLKKINIATVIAYLIPLLILGYVIYLNWLPFGYEKTYILDVGAKGDIDSSKELYLVKNKDLSPIYVEDNKTFRYLTGTAELVFNPKVVLRNATIDVSVTGENVFVGSSIDFDKNDWDMFIDFSNGIPEYLTGDAVYNGECAYINWTSRLVFPRTENRFESGPFTVYAEWVPENKEDNFQEIVGHYNWELLQEKNQVRFLVGRMNNATGPFYSVSYNVDSSFFNKKHSALAIYNPGENGYIELFVDNNFAERKYIGNDVIWNDYGDNFPLSFGKSEHGAGSYYIGCLYSFGFKDSISSYFSNNNFKINKNKLTKIFGDGKLDLVKVNLEKQK